MEERLKWYKRTGGKIFIVFFALFILFAGYFFSQVWRFYRLIQKGDVSTLSEFNFGDKFTVDSKLPVKKSEKKIDILSDDDPTLGSQGAKLKVVEFADFYCPFSREVSFTLRELISKYKDSIYFIYKDFPLDQHPLARQAAEAGQCALEQGKFWAFHDKMFQNPVSSVDEIKFYALQIGLDTAVFNDCLDSGKYRDEVQKDLEEGVAAGVRGTPTFFINGVKIEGAIPGEIWEEIVKRLD